MSELFRAHVGPQNKIVHVYDSFQNMQASPYLLPNGEYQVTTFPAEARAKRQCIIVRPTSSSTVTKKSGSAGSGGQSVSTMSASNYIGQPLGVTTDGTPAYMGAMISPAELIALKAQGVPFVKGNIQFTQPVQSYGGGISPMSVMGGETIEIADWIIGLVILVCALIVVAGAAVWVSKNKANQAAALAQQEEFNMRTHVADDVAQSTQVQSEYDAGGKHYLVYKNGTVISTDSTTGKVTTEYQGTTVSDITSALTTTTPGQINWNQIATYAVVGVLLIGGVYIGVTYGYPYAKSKYSEYKRDHSHRSSA